MPPLDTYFPLQWHLLNNGQTGGRAGVDLNVVPVWDYYLGAGVRVGVYDNGVYVDHPDLIGNWDPSLQPIIDGRPWKPNPITWRFGNGGEGGAAHGTAVAGLISSPINGFGVVGVAPESSFGAAFAYPARNISVFEYSTIFRDQVYQQYSQLALYDVTNHSYGPTRPFNALYTIDDYMRAVSYFADSAANGRNGLGTVHVVSAGNSRIIADYTSTNPLTNIRQSISVAAGSNQGDIMLYSTAGPANLVTAPVDVNLVLGPPAALLPDSIFATTTVDIPGIDKGYTTTGFSGSLGPNFSYTSVFNGTSSAAPMVSGVVALMLEANANLGYRDVQDILAISARQPWQTGSYELSEQQTNGATNINGGGFRYSTDYGFGFADAAAAVRLAESWQGQHTAANEIVFSTGSFNLDTPFPANADYPYQFEFSVDANFELEWVELDANLDHQFWGDLTLTLIAPSGTEHRLLDRIGKSPDFAYDLKAANLLGQTQVNWLEDNGQFGIEAGADGSTLNQPFASAASRGESSQGVWRFQINGESIDQGGTGASGILNSVELRLFGKEQSGSAGADQTTFYFSDDYETLLSQEPERFQAIQSATPVAINVAASSQALVVNLQETQALLGTASIQWDDSTIVNSIFGGDGTDLITGSIRNETIYGGWNNDVIIYGGGQDIWSGGFGADQFQLNANLLDPSLLRNGANQIEFLDFSANEDRLEIINTGSSNALQLVSLDGNIAQLAFQTTDPALSGGVITLVNASGAWDPSYFQFA